MEEEETRRTERKRRGTRQRDGRAFNEDEDILESRGGEEQRREVPRKLWRNRECRKDKTQTDSGENETEGSVGGR